MYCVQVTLVVHTNKIPAELVINSDQTGIPLIPSPQYTRAPKGAKDVSVNGYGEKRQITVTPSNSADGRSLPLQVRRSVLCLYSVCCNKVAQGNSNAAGLQVHIDFTVMCYVQLTRLLYL
jgi:hypothetical protein